MYLYITCIRMCACVCVCQFLLWSKGEDLLIIARSSPLLATYLWASWPAGASSIANVVATKPTCLYSHILLEETKSVPALCPFGYHRLCAMLFLMPFGCTRHTASAVCGLEFEESGRLEEAFAGAVGVTCEAEPRARQALPKWPSSLAVRKSPDSRAFQDEVATTTWQTRICTALHLRESKPFAPRRCREQSRLLQIRKAALVLVAAVVAIAVGFHEQSRANVPCRSNTKCCRHSALFQSREPSLDFSHTQAS